MVERNDVLNLNFYNKSPFMGSDKGIRYRIEKCTPEDGDAFLLTTVWPEPFSFDATAEEDKTKKEFAFSEDGMTEAISFINSFPRK